MQATRHRCSVSYKTMTLATGEFIQRFMLHVAPKGFHRIRHYGMLAKRRTKTATLARARQLIAASTPAQHDIAPCKPTGKTQPFSHM